MFIFSLNNAFPAEQHNDMFFTIWYGVYHKSSERLLYSSGGHPPAVLIPEVSHKNPEMVRLKTPGFIVGGTPDVTYHKKTQRIDRSSRLIVFSDGVYDITKADGSIWGFDKYLEFIARPSTKGKSCLDNLLHHVQDLNPKKAFDDDFTILEIVFSFSSDQLNLQYTMR
jgi:sigma-B regulation protein RsbU (phosphoserine phosphatase)